MRAVPEPSSGFEAELREFMAWSSENADQTTHPVGQKKPNAWGLYDIRNVWEWCADWYDADYYKRSPEKDPPGPDSGKAHVFRGDLTSSRSTVDTNDPIVTRVQPSGLFGSAHRGNRDRMVQCSMDIGFRVAKIRCALRPCF